MGSQACHGRRLRAFGCTNDFFTSLRLANDYAMRTFKFSRNRLTHVGHRTRHEKMRIYKSSSTQRGYYNARKAWFHSRCNTTNGGALIIVLAFVVLFAGLALAYFSRTTTVRQLAQSSSSNTSADLLAKSALDITVSDLKQEILAHPTPTAAPPYYIQPARYPAGIPDDNPNLIRYSSRNAAASRASTVSSTATSANGRSISLARWNSHYLIPPANASGIDSTPVASFVAPDWVLVTTQGPNPIPQPNAVIGRYAFAVYDEGGLIDVNVGGFPNYANLTRPNRPTRRLRP